MEDQQNNRWAFSDLSEAIDWCLKRQTQGIKVTLDPLGEYASNKDQAVASANEYIKCISEINDAGIVGGSVALKLSAIGLSFDKDLAEEMLDKILTKAKEASVLAEIDMEGTPSVAETISLAQKKALEGNCIVLALQAYLDRTVQDFKDALDNRLKIRLVKGAYLGDITDFTLIQDRFMSFFQKAIASGKTFDVGTHDPLVLKNCQTIIGDEKKGQVTFGFLKGLAEETKVLMVKDGFQVSEYVPYGDGSSGYIKRREAYLRALQRIKRMPAL